jgi:xylan 1,4-beta-xylosidase
MVCRSVQKVHAEIQASPFPALPLIWTEFNASWSNHPEVTDAPFMGPWLAETIRQCDGFVKEMSYWTFSDVFEEQGVVKTPFYGGFGLIAAGGIPKPGFNAFALLHDLGEQRLAIKAAGVLVTRRSDGALVLALWNYAEVGERAPLRTVALRIMHSTAANANVQSIDHEHGNVLTAYERMGSPRYPTQRELVQLREGAALPAAVSRPLRAGELDLQIPSDGLVLVTVPAGS